ncbi:hypothetical protein T459_21999 [Capsicum annuum]|uniref:Ubiquitin-like protease family profile domain-containing protein n=1 Tax=Capsicum annuum TaxID=4072 RepID=A0A2G2YY89_CAPAN|nr:hypothetical protein T459_21999 [Capsicum annuum]
MAEQTPKSQTYNGISNSNLVYDCGTSFSLGLTQEDVVKVVSNSLQSKKSEKSEEIRSKFRNDPLKMKNILKKKNIEEIAFSKRKKRKNIQKKRKAKEIEGLTKVDEDVQISFDDDSEDVSEEEGMPLATQVWLYECCSNVPPKIASKVDNRIFQLLNWKTIAPRPRFDFLMNAMFNDDGKDPPPRKSNEHSNKKQKVDSSTPVVKKPLRKKQVDSFDEYTQTRTSAPRTAKADGMKTLIFKSILIRQTSSSKTAKGKQTAREQVEDIEADKAANVDEGGLEQSGQHFSPDVVQSPDNISNSTKTSDEKIDETILSDSQFIIPDEMLPSLNVYQIQSIIIHPSTNRQEESHHEILDAKTSETVIEDHDQINRGITDSEVELDTEEQVRTPPNTQEVTNDEQRDEKLWLDSLNTIPNEVLPSLNIYNQKSIIIHLSANSEVKTPRPKLRIRRPSKFKESSYTEKFGLAAVPWHTVEDIFIPVNIKEKHHWVLAVFSFSERCIFLYDSYEFSGHYAAVLAEIEKIAKIISLCLQACDFYVKKGIDHQSHPRYKDKESSNIFDLLFQDDLPQQSSESLDCCVFMAMYAECLSYGHKVIAFEFDPNALCTRYAALLWDYGIRKQEANTISDVEAPVRPARQSRITSVTEVVDV